MSSFLRTATEQLKPILMKRACDLAGDTPAATVAAKLFFSVADHFSLKCAAIDACQIFFHCRCEQGEVRDFAEVFGDEPDRFVGGHPVPIVESRQVYRA